MKNILMDKELPDLVVGSSLRYLWIDGMFVEKETKKNLIKEIAATRNFLYDLDTVLELREAKPISWEDLEASTLKYFKTAFDNYWNSHQFFHTSLGKIYLLGCLTVSQLRDLKQQVIERERYLVQRLTKFFHKVLCYTEVERNKPYLSLFAFIDFIENVRKELESFFAKQDSIKQLDLAHYSFHHEHNKRTHCLSVAA